MSETSSCFQLSLPEHKGDKESKKITHSIVIEGAKYPPNLKGDLIVEFLNDKANKDHYSFVVKNA